MIKAVPDPPAEISGSLHRTAQAAFGSCSGAHDALFDVREGIAAEEALAHIQSHLQSAHEIAKRIQVAPGASEDLHGATVWAIDASHALVAALLSGVEHEQIPAKPASLIVRKTAARAFGNLGNGHAQMFCVRAGIEAEDALVHVSLYLKAAYATADELVRMTPGADQGLHWAILHSVEAAQALVEGLLRGAGV